MASVEITIPPRSAYVGVVRLAVASLARYAGLDEDRVEDLRTAVSEACTNAVLASEDAGTDDAVVMRWTEEPARLMIDVEGRGTPVSSAEPTDSQGFATRDVLSMALLESLVDETTIEAFDGRTRTRLILNRPGS